MTMNPKSTWFDRLQALSLMMLASRTAIVAGKYILHRARAKFVVSTSVAVFVVTLTMRADEVVDHQAPMDDQVSIETRSSAELSHGVISVGQLCDVSGGNAAKRRMISQLDVLDFAEGDEGLTISHREIEMRLRIAGLDRDDYRIDGPTRCRVKTAVAKNWDTAILQAIGISYAKLLNVAPDDLEIQLTQPLPSSVSAQVTDETRIEPIMATSARLGPQQVRIGLHQHDQLISTISVGINIVLFKHVLVTTKRLEPGTMITSADVIGDRRPLSLRELQTLPDVVVGKVTKAAVKSGAVVTSTDLTDPVIQRPIVIKRRDTVEVVVRKAQLRVLLKGAMAMEQGKVGDVIQVQNQETKKTLSARVVGPGRVEIRL